MRARSLAVGLAAGMLLLGCAADDADPGTSSSTLEDSVPATSGPDSEHLLVSGVVSRDGEPVAGSTVSVVLWPEDTSEIKVGEVVDTLEAAVTEADEEGTFTLLLDPDELSSKYFNGSFLNFDLTVLTRDRDFATWGSTVWLVRDEYWRSDERALVGDAAAEISVALAGPTITLTDSFGEDESSEPSVATATTAP